MELCKKSRLGLRILPLVALAAIVVSSLPGRAEDRAVKTKIAPIYPDIARRLHISGEVEIEATVDASGNVTEAKAVSGNGLLTPPAVDAVRKWRFEAGAGEAKVKVTVNFVAQ